jgi:putative PIN family toxin of toxin-antitoxin system
VKAVLDTNVLVSGIFFGGLPRRILDAWADEKFELVLTPLIFDEYIQTCDRLSASHPDLEYQAILVTIVGHGTLIPDVDSSEPITADPDDDKFMLCAEQAGAKVISGDKHLLEATGWSGVEVLKPREFLSLLR